MTPASTPPADDRPRFLVCEDGSEYLERFTRFLDEEFLFEPAGSAAALLALLARPAAGVILDLDFRRTAPEALIDEQGHTLPAAELDPATRRRLAESQGIHILRLLRSRGLRVPVLLFADLDDAGQARYLETSLAPLSIVRGSEGLAQTAARLRALAGAR